MKEEFETVFPQSPQVTALTNGEWTTVLTSVGAGHSIYRGMDMTRRSTDLLRRPLGVYALVRHPGGVLNVTSAPDYTGGVRRSVEFSAKSVTYTAEDGSLTAGMQVCVHPTFAAEQRQIVLKNTSGRRVTAEVLLYFEPVIARTADDAAHPAFSKLFVRTFHLNMRRRVNGCCRPRTGSRRCPARLIRRLKKAPARPIRPARCACGSSLARGSKSSSALCSARGPTAARRCPRL